MKDLPEDPTKLLDLSIDEFALDQEWLTQPSLAMKWGRLVADAVFYLDQARSELDLVKAEIDQQVRMNPDEYGLTKVTETSVSHAIIASHPHQNATIRISQCKHEVGVLHAAVIAIEHRKRALEKLVDLNAREYFSKPRATESTTDIMEEVEKREIRSKGKNRVAKADRNDD